ncbi:MAG: glycosyltransferase [Candidatus Theseobacter exili]|nr:glycosyltransferase [Candidatus Theseobacter exili]
MYTFLVIISSFLLYISLIGISSFYIFYPLALWFFGFFKEKPINSGPAQPTVSMIIVTRNSEAIIKEKLDNCLSIDYPRNKLQITFVSDASTDNTNNIISEYQDKGIHHISINEHKGKINALNYSTPQCTGDILVYTDTDALLEPDSIKKMMKYYEDPDIGGICGQAVILKDTSQLKEAQSLYLDLDSKIKKLESHIGSITSNVGKLFSIRKKLFEQIPPAVTDDLYTALSIVRQKYRFIYDPELKAYIKALSRNSSHEIERRRRIVSTSIRAILYNKSLLNPLKYGFFSIGLLVNKIIRRMQPFFLLFLLISSSILYSQSVIISVLFLAQLALYLTAIGWIAVLHFNIKNKYVYKLCSYTYYFCIGNYGMLLGSIDFFKGIKISKWNPVKGD